MAKFVSPVKGDDEKTAANYCKLWPYKKPLAFRLNLSVSLLEEDKFTHPQQEDRLLTSSHANQETSGQEIKASISLMETNQTWRTSSTNQAVLLQGLFVMILIHLAVPQ